MKQKKISKIQKKRKLFLFKLFFIRKPFQCMKITKFKKVNQCKRKTFFRSLQKHELKVQFLNTLNVYRSAR
jgi:hypothetical protein